jgi:hypothetical protein
MKHKHAELITRWVNDTSLVILAKLEGNNWKVDLTHNMLEWCEDTDYFLVPNCHVEVALAWLNGETLQCLYQGTWCDTAPLRDKVYIFIPENEYRIKPKTKQVKVWVGMSLCGMCPPLTVLKIPHENWTEGYTWTEVMVEQGL